MRPKWDIEHVYFYVVSFVTLFVLIIGAINITRATIAYLTPVDPPHVTKPYPAQEDDKTMQLWRQHLGNDRVDQELERSREIARRNSQKDLIRELVSSLAYIVIGLPLYLYHWRRIPCLD